MQWQFLESIPIPIDLQKEVAGHPLVSQVLLQRGIQTPGQARAFLDPDIYQPASSFSLPGMEKAVSLLINAIARKEQITVWGDFDVDGQTSTTLLVSALKQLGANVNYYIPVRGRESHGINPDRLRQFISAGTQLLLTCDTGISEVNNIALARAAGLKVLITDHHQLPDMLPHAEAIVNPQFLAPSHPLAGLPGVGVAYKLIEALTSELNDSLDVSTLLDLVALGIVADVASVTADNRYLLQKGLRTLRASQRLGLQQLLRKAELEAANLDEELIGFQIAPRLNAIGRLADANPVVELLLTDDPGRAEVIATQIEGLNQQRKMLTFQVTQAAINLLERSSEIRHAPIIILHHPDWPGGILGLAASRLAERFNKPAILLSGEGQTIHGSARSVMGLDITQALRSQAELLNGFGGHAMAGGLSLPLENLPAFQAGIARFTQQALQAQPVEQILEIHAKLDLISLDLALVDDLQRLAPFGPGNPALTFISTDLTIASARTVGKNQEHRQVTISDTQGNTQKVVWWQGAEIPLPNGRFDLAYHLNDNDYRGERELALVWVDAREQTPMEVRPEERQVLDYRHSKSPLADLQSLLEAEQDLLVWAELNLPQDFTGHTRLDLRKAKTLVIWQVPPSSQTLQSILEAVQPAKIALFGYSESIPDSQSFIKHLAGLLKHAINKKQGQFTPLTLAVACGLSLEMVQLGLRWLGEKGIFQFEKQSDLLINVKPGSGVQGSAFAQVNQGFQVLWQEHLAYQQFYLESKKDQLL